MEVDCMCRVHLRVEEEKRSEGQTEFLKCTGHGKECPCFKQNYKILWKKK